MRALCEALWELQEAKEILSRVSGGGCPVAVGGLSAVHKAHIIAAVRRKTGRPVVVVCPDEGEAAKILRDCSVFSEEEGLLLRDREFSFYPVENASREWEHKRLPALYNMASCTAPIVAGAVDAFMRRTLPPAILLEQSLVLREGMTIPPETLRASLVRSGYTRSEQVEGVGQFASRGGIIDVFPPGRDAPVRIEYFDNEIDTICPFDTITQRRTDRIPSCVILPAAETLAHAAPDGVSALADKIEAAGNITDAELLRNTGHLPSIDKYLALVYPELYTAADYIPKNAVVFISEQLRTGERIKNTLWQQNEDIERLLEKKAIPSALCVFGYDDLAIWQAFSRYDCVQLDLFLAGSYALRPHAIMNITAKQLPSFGASLETASGDIGHYREGGYRTMVMVPDEIRKKHLEELLRDAGIPVMLSELPEKGAVGLSAGALSAGLEYPGIQLAVLTEGRQEKVMRRRRTSSSRDSSKKRLTSYTDLAPGDLVVHEHHGIGRFTGLCEMKIDGVMKDYIHIAYAGTDALYVPVTQLHLVSKYIGSSEDGHARLHKLGGTEWAKARVKAKAAAKDLARELIALYAERKRREGFAFPPDDDWQQGFEQSFEYEDTEDQSRCSAEIKRDMEASSPMDRLLCGDVGFGKTEVALRAVMKCVLGGRQAALLVPTTVLAQQHYQTALRRFAGYPVRIDVLSRFRTPAQCAKTLKQLSLGQLDFVIGTHKLLQKSVKFKKLGLLVVDEEQRFGVSHKERLKEISRQVDVLTLTATPIPRTLNMALSGIRDLSTIDEAPRDRYPVQTFVLEHDWPLIIDAIRREVSRGGQVYYLHNRVETIDRVASRLIKEFEDVTVGVAHGQMKEAELSDVMAQVVSGDAQILVCTTIIETGLDIPNVNTLIVEDADKLGLAQLHQIRGRVGRSNRHAFAYLTYKRGKILQEDAQKRLSAIREFAEFGSGLKIAMRDLEIRGAGNVLGSEQSGHMLSVGYEMYLRLLEEAVLEEQGGNTKQRVECTVDLPVKAGIPEKYIAHAGIRMDFYRRIAALENAEEASELIDELCDRYGDVPDSVNTLSRIALLRAAASSRGISEISQKTGRLNFTLANPDFARVAQLCGLNEYKGRILFSAGSEPYLSLKLTSGEDIISIADRLIKDYNV